MTSAVTVALKTFKLSLVRKVFFNNYKQFPRYIMNNKGNDGSFDIALHNQYLGKFKEYVPELTSDLHKGECGRIGVIGGSAEYTGAPYFAAISALKAGADLVYIFCCKEAARVIKSYSPELIVLPLLDDVDALMKIEPWLSRLHALVVGPGLGREFGLQKTVADIINYCGDRPRGLPLVIDADGLFLVTENMSLLKKYKGPVILTPNAIEYSRLSSKFPVPDPLEIAKALNVIILQKGSTDFITNGMCSKQFHFESKDLTMKCSLSGSNRRCGGQGDILSGCLGTFVAWFHIYKQKLSITGNSDAINSITNEEKLAWFRNNFMGYSLACYVACTITRTCNKFAFEENGRGLTASDMIPFINKVFRSLFGE